MSVTKTTIRKLGQDKDLYDTGSYSSDSAFFADNPINLKSESGRVKDVYNAEAEMEAYKQGLKAQIIKENPNLHRAEKVEPKVKTKTDIIGVEGYGFVKKGFSGQRADTENYETAAGLKKLSKEKGIASRQVKSMLAEKAKARDKIDTYAVNKIIKESEVSSAKLSQKLRKDRLLKKVARAKMYEARMKTYARAEGQQLRAQRKLSAILNRKKREQLMTQGEVKQMYGRALPEGNDGVLLHARDAFFSQDGRERSERTQGNILSAPNLLFQTRKQAPNQRQKWL